MGTRTTLEFINGTTTITCLVVCDEKKIHEGNYFNVFFVFSLKIKQADRPATYEDIQASPVMKSLPEEITPGEKEMVHNVIANIPVIPEDY